MVDRRWLCMLALLGVVAACDDETASPIDLGPTGPPRIAFLDPAPAADGSSPACVSIGTDPAARVPLLLEATELLLRPPGACGVVAQCGSLALFVDDVLNNEGAVPSIELLLHKLADRYHDGTVHAGTGEPDVLHLRVEVRGEDGEVMLDHDGEELVAELPLVTVESCVGPARQP